MTTPAPKITRDAAHPASAAREVVSIWETLPGYPWLPCPICGGTEGCDHTVPERARAAIAAKIAAAYKAGVEAAARNAARARPAPSIDDVHKALVEQYDAMLEANDSCLNDFDNATPAERDRDRAAYDRYRKAEDEVMRLSYPLWRAQNLVRSITVNAHCDGRIKGFLPPIETASAAA